MLPQAKLTFVSVTGSKEAAPRNLDKEQKTKRIGIVFWKMYD
jgi:hypothetical protein